MTIKSGSRGLKSLEQNMKFRATETSTFRTPHSAFYKVGLFGGQGRPIAGFDKACPIERVAGRRFSEQFELDLTQRFASPDSLFEVCVIAGHKLACDVIAHRPQAHYQRFCSGELE